MGQGWYRLSCKYGERMLTADAQVGRGHAWRITGRDDLGRADTLGVIVRRWADWAKGLIESAPVIETLDVSDSISQAERDALLQGVG